jgi:hypothetical protein
MRVMSECTVTEKGGLPQDTNFAWATFKDNQNSGARSQNERLKTLSILAPEF